MQCLTWLAVKPAPRDFIENFVGAADFWANKIRVQYKKTAPPQTAFVDNYKKLILELMAYVKEWHTTGVTWNPQVVTTGVGGKESWTKRWLLIHLYVTKVLTVLMLSFLSQGLDIDAYVAGGAEAEAPKTAAPTAPATAPAPPKATTAAPADGGKKALFGDISKGK